MTANANGNAYNSAQREAWLKRLESLVTKVETWAADLGWDSKRIQKQLDDGEAYAAPALVLQQDTIRIVLEPITPAAPGADGVVDLYLLPGYDDIASLYLIDGNWQLHYMFPDQGSVATIRDAESLPFTRASFAQVLNCMKQNAV